MVGCTVIATVLPFEKVTYGNTIVVGYFSFAVTEVAVLTIASQLANQVVIYSFAWKCTVCKYRTCNHTRTHVHTYTVHTYTRTHVHTHLCTLIVHELTRFARRHFKFPRKM